MWIIPELGPNETRQQSKLDRFFDHQTKAQALVRESIQNSLDAEISKEKPVRISFSFDTVQVDTLKKYLEGDENDLSRHLNACGIDLSSEEYSFLVIEDFNTEGLTGPIDNMSYEEDGTPVSGNFIGFWWSEGLSDKRKGSGGSHGVGKITLSTSSKLNTFLAYTIRDDSDDLHLLIGYSQLKYHSFDKHQFKGYARYGKKDQSNRIWPYRGDEDTETVEQFCKDFGLKRSSETGLSVVIPAIDEDINSNSIIASVIKEFYVPLMRGQLEVNVFDSDQELLISSDNVMSIADKHLSSSKDKELIKCAQGMLKLMDSGMFYSKHDTDLGKARKRGIQAEDFSENDLERMQSKFASGQMVGAAILVKIKTTDNETGEKTIKSSRFHIFIKNDEESDLKRSTNYIRDKLLINNEGGGVIKPFSVAFVYITDEELSEFLKYAEDPGHERWVYRTLYENGNIDKENDTPLRLIKGAVGDFYNLLAGVAEDETVENVLPEIFSIPEKKTGGKNGGTSPDPDPEPTTRSKSPFVLSKISGGFKVKNSKDIDTLLETGLIDLPFRIKVRMGYYKTTGGGITKYNPLDFDLSETTQFDVTPSNAATISREGNELVFEITNKKYSVTVNGFDENRDLEIRCQLITAEVA